MATLKSPFYTGRAVTTDFLNESQYFGPSNRGIVFTANPINQWEYPLLDTSQFDMADLAANFVTKSGNVTVSGTKTFTTTPQIPTEAPGTSNGAAASTEFVVLALSGAITNGGFVDVNSTQTVVGFKTFQNIAVPLQPSFANSPVSFDYLGANYVPLIGNTNISGIKTFGQPPEVPAPTAAPHATPKAYVDSIASALGSNVSAAQVAITALQAAVADLSVTAGSYPGASGTINYYVVKFANNAKMLIATGAGSANKNETIAFPTLAQGFSGFASAPIVMASGLGASTQLFAPLVDNVTTIGFDKHNETFGGGGGSSIAYLAFGI